MSAPASDSSPCAAHHDPHGWHEGAFIAHATGGRWLREPDAPARRVRIDTREIQPGDAFVALRGERTDGHRFLHQARAAGASVAIIDDPDACASAGGLPEELGVLLVGHAEHALRDWARAHRDRLIGTRVVGVAGSAGKTTTVRLVHAALRTQLRGSHAPKSFNNHLGVALTLLGARPDDGYVVCEIGTSAPGETGDLAELVRPHVGILTSLGREHLEGLGSLEGVADEASAITRGLDADGALVLPAGEPLLDSRTRGPWRRLRFGADAGADVRVEAVEQAWDGVRARLAGHEVRLPLVGAHNAHNAAAAIAAVRALGLDEARAAEGLRETEAAPMRLERLEIRGVRVLHDAYNAHPDSTRAALATLGAIAPAPGGRRVAILGEMLELGPSADREHAELGDWIRQTGACDALITLGRRPALAASAGGLGDVATLERERDARPSDAACAEAAAMLRAGDVVLIKASRGVGLERVVEALGKPERGQG